MVKQKYCKDHYDRLTELALVIHKLWKKGVDVSSRAINISSEYGKLRRAATSKGITWQEVLIAAGLPLDEVMRTYTKRYWPTEHYERLTVLALEVHKLWKSGVDVSSKSIRYNLGKRKLYSAAYDKGITWQEVLVAAGIPLDEFIEERTRVWSADHYERLTELALKVHKLWKSGVDISASAITHNTEHRKIISATFGKGISWQEVLVAAGIPMDEIIKKRGKPNIYSLNHYERLTELALIVRKLWKSGVDVSSKAIIKNTKHRKYVGAAGWAGISWQEVLIAAGIPLDDVNQDFFYKCKYPMDHYERLTVLALEVHRLWKNGVDVSSMGIKSNSEYGKLIAAAGFCHITWQEVLVAAGLPLDEVMRTYTKRYWPTEHYERLTVLALEVHKLWKSGVDVSSVGIHKNLEHRRLQSAANFLGINWQEVLVAAGIPLNEVMRDTKNRLGYDT